MHSTRSLCFLVVRSVRKCFPMIVLTVAKVRLVISAMPRSDFASHLQLDDFANLSRAGLKRATDVAAGSIIDKGNEFGRGAHDSPPADSELSLATAATK
jgi:hypothetical protein